MPPLDERMPERIRAAATEALERYRVPGISIGVVRGDDLVFSDAFGYADIESATPMSPERRQCIASISKTMVGLSVMALVDEGRLRLQDRIVDLLPDVRFAGPAATMTLWHLLTHTAGIGEAPTQERLMEAVNPNPGARPTGVSFAETFADGIVIECEPGTKWHYANVGYELLGEILLRTERADSLDAVLRRRIFGPLGMEATDALGESNDALTTGYHRAPNEDNRFQLERAGVTIQDEPTVDGQNIRGTFRGEFSKSGLAAGGVQSNVPDMARYASSLLRKSAGIVRPGTFDQMIAPQYCPDARLVNWGLSYIRTPRYGRTFIGHGGAYFGGWNSNLAVLPDEGIAVIQHMNIMMDEPAPVFRSIQRAVLDVTEPSFPAMHTDTAILGSAPGTYRLTPGRLTNFRPASRIGPIEISRDGDALVLRSRWGKWKAGEPLTPCDPADPAFFAIAQPGADPAYIALTHDEAGRVSGLRCDELVYMARG
jgi:CubicO group peptidase (beta-lactamase class C family)